MTGQGIWPSTRGNVWMLQQDGDVLRYMSDQDAGRVIGFEERGGTTLAQTPPLAIAMIGFGAGVSTERPLPDRYRWHVLDETLTGFAPNFTAESHAALTQMLRADGGRALQTCVALSASQPGIVAPEATPEAELYSTVLTRLRDARQGLADWGKGLFIDRVVLCLLAGAPDTSESDADAHYADIARALRRDVAAETRQASFPLMVVSQSAGSQTDGSSAVILAEGRLDIEHPTTGFVVATPKYPFAMRPDMPATHTPEAQMLIDEIEVRAVRARQAGQKWHCPSLRLAWKDAREIVADFATLGDLVLEPGAHGFRLDGCENGAVITEARVEDNRVILTCSKIPRGDAMTLSYAWGATRDSGQGRAANVGALRDDWQADSIAIPGRTLYRYALSGRVALTRTPF